jgi:tetratricopeptide (TPR) repeat protein
MAPRQPVVVLVLMVAATWILPLKQADAQRVCQRRCGPGQEHDARGCCRESRAARRARWRRQARRRAEARARARARAERERKARVAQAKKQVALTAPKRFGFSSDEVAPKLIKPPGSDAGDALSVQDFFPRAQLTSRVSARVLAAQKKRVDQTTLADPAAPRRIHRLASLHAQNARYWRDCIQRVERRIADADDPKRKLALQSLQDRFLAYRKKALQRSLAAYQLILQNPRYKSYKARDSVLLARGGALMALGQQKEALKVFRQLVNKHPNSKLVPTAYVAFGDFYFRANQMASAERFYGKAMKSTKPIASYARFMLGWAHLNSARHADALRVFWEVVKRARGGGINARLRTEARDGFVRAYAEVGKASMADTAMKKMGSRNLRADLDALGHAYIRLGKAQDAVVIYRKLLSLFPTSVNTCNWQYNIAYATLSFGTRDEKTKAIVALSKAYTDLRDKRRAAAKTVQRCRTNSETMLASMAKIWHNESSKTLDRTTRQNALRLYDSYLADHPNGKLRGDMAYYRAELLYSMAESERNRRRSIDRWKKAAMAFASVLKSKKVSTKRRNDAAYAHVLAIRNSLDMAHRRLPPRSLKRVPLPGWVKQMIGAFDTYLKYTDSQAPERVMIAFLRARMFWRFGHFDKSDPAFESIVDNHPDHETAEYSANILLDTFNKTHRYARLKALVDKLLAKTSFMARKPKLKKRLESLRKQMKKRPPPRRPR